MVDFLVVGGGCFGTFYTRQLLRGADRIGLGRIRIVDHDPNCRAAREYGSLQDHRIAFHFEDWKSFLLGYFSEVLERLQRGDPVPLPLQDQYVPPTFAPHILFEIFLELARGECPGTSFAKRPYEGPVGTPVDMALPAGTRALSFATWTCPATCIEPPTCPHTRGPKDWDMKDYLEKHLGEGVDGLHVFQCRHYAMGVGTIPVRTIAEEYLKFRAKARTPGTHRVAMATVSSCHGLIGLVEAKHV